MMVFGAEEKTQQLRALTVIEVLSSIPNTRMAVHNYL